MSFWMMNLGCKVNRVESDSIASALSASGREALSGQDADVIIINTCTVTSDAEKKTRKAIRRALAMNADARVVVTGCAVAIDPQTYAAMDERIIVEPDKSKVTGIAEALLGDGGLTGSDVGKALLRFGGAFPTRVGIKVQDGCDNACTYCIVHTARGKANSRPYGEVLQEARAYVEAGVNELVLTGINLGSYRFGEQCLTDLLKGLVEVSDSARFRISSIEPCDVDPRLVSLLARSQGRVCRHLHLPLQSGSSEILAAMARPYNADVFRRLVDSLYASIPSLSLSSDIIVGFPGETEEDFERTMELAAYCRFSKIHVFRYSPRKGTPAASMDGQIAHEVKASRAERLAGLARSMRQQDLERRRGSVETVLVETGGQGTTESYHRVDVPLDARPGSLVSIML